MQLQLCTTHVYEHFVTDAFQFYNSLVSLTNATWQQILIPPIKFMSLVVTLARALRECTLPTIKCDPICQNPT